MADEETAGGSTRWAAWVVTVTLAVLGGLVVVALAFSQSNAPQTIDGRSATTSQFVD